MRNSFVVPVGFIVGQLIAASLAQAQDADQSSSVDEVVVTGYRYSLESSTKAKRDSVSFTDSIFAEDIGKFPDTNIAESFNRIPGITITREISGEGLNVAIRGLGTNFTRVLLNGAPVAIASTGRTDAQNTNREVDLDLFPIELFNQLTVNKTATAGMTEGGAAGTVDMRSARPFDQPDRRLVYSIQGTDNSVADDMGFRASLVGSNTWGNFGALVGVAAVQNKVRTTGFETIGWTNPNQRSAASTEVTVSAANPLGHTDINPTVPGVQISVGPTCTQACNGTGGGNFTIPALVPANAGAGLVQDTPIDGAFLLANNPGRTLQQLDNAIIPRLGRPSDEFGDKDRYNGIVSLEYRPRDEMRFYLDSMYGKKENDLERIDMNWVGRNGAVIPLNVQVDRDDCTNGCVVTSGTFANAQLFLEYRPFIEDTDFWGVNPGFEWDFNDRWTFDIQANMTESNFHRESPTVLVNTPGGSGVTVDYVNDGGIPQITTNVDLNNPANFVWAGGRVNIQDERRKTETEGIRSNLRWGDDDLNLRFGASWDKVNRRINAFDNSQFWQNAICGGNPSVQLQGPNTQPPCQGLTAADITPGAGGYPAYPGLGTGFSAGTPGPVSYSGSLIPQTSLANYLLPGPSGFITVDWRRLVADSNYNTFHDQAPEAGSSNTGASAGFVEEKVTAGYVEFNGRREIGTTNVLRYNVGVRYTSTDQTIGGRVTFPDNRNILPPPNTPNPPPCLAVPAATPTDPIISADGGCYPQVVTFALTDHTYENWLPALNLALNVGDNAVVRGSVSRTMTRANPNTMLPGINFSSPSADVANIGNPELDPFVADNIDLGFEYYTGNEGYFGFAAFRKKLKGFTVNGSETVPFTDLAAFGITFDTLTQAQQTAINSRGGPNAATVVLQQQVNASGDLTVNGLEFNWVQPLDFIGLRGFGFTANMTFVDQKGEGAAPAIAVGVAPETYNATLYYEDRGISARVSRTYAEGSQASNPNQNGIPAAAIFGTNYGQWDFSASFDLGRMFNREATWYPQLTIDVINFTDEEQRSYFQFPNAAFTNYQPGRQILFGLRGAF